MFGTVELPVWLFALILLFAAVTAASHLFIPPVRWFFRRRMERAVTQLNRRLERPIQPFKLARRTDTIQRLIYDPKVAEAVTDHARETGTREDVAFDTAKRYAREIVPSFSASAYFGFATRAAHWLSTLLYDVRVTGETAQLDPDATVVFVMNHRSNMDYVLVTYLSAKHAALSYAVGEWARVWPLTMLIRAMGAYFIRRRSRNALYRRVLARYVQLSVRAGDTQGIFPEGGLSQTGAVATPRLGLLSYIVADVDPRERDVIFVPVSLNYDHILEDRILTEAAATGQKRFRGSFPTATAFALRWLWRRARRRALRFGMAAVAIGQPLSLRAFGAVDSDAAVADLGKELARRLRQGVPVLPIPLAAAALRQGATDREGLVAAMADIAARLAADGHPVHLPDGGVEAAMDAALDKFRLRHIIEEADGRILVRPTAERLVAFYAASLGPPHAAVQHDSQAAQ